MLRLPTRQEPPRARWLSISEASALLGVNPTTLRTWADQGQVRTFRTPGGHRRFAEPDLAGLLSAGGRPGIAAIERPSRLRLQPDLRQALAQMRRGLSDGARTRSGWADGLPDEQLEELRALGRRLVQMVPEYVAGHRSEGLAQEAMSIGSRHGAAMARQEMPFRRVLEAFLFFRDLLEDAVYAPVYRAAAPGEREDVRRRASAFLDHVLLGAVSGYEDGKLASHEEPGGRR